MDATRFDRLSRGVAAAGSRRAALAVGAAALLATVGLGSARAGPRCEACERRAKNGRCRRKPDGAVCQGKPCCACADGRCPERAADAPCNGDGRCYAGVCNPRPTCLAAGAGCPGDCCSGRCVIAVGQSTGVCGKGAGSAPCRAGDECQSGTCTGYRCD